MTTPSIALPDLAGNPPEASTGSNDLLHFADLVCEERAKAFTHYHGAEFALIGFLLVMRRHFAALTTLAEVEQTANALLVMMRRWEHQEEADFHLLDQEVDAATTRILREMPYPEYLQTDHWQAKRAEALERAGNRCQVCNSASSLQIHHRTYERRGAELPEDLIALCSTCHATFHKNGRLAR